MAVRGEARVCEAHEAKSRVELVRVPFYIINLWLITDSHRFCTYTYYLRLCRTGLFHDVIVLLG
jgi:hypothetical protein